MTQAIEVFLESVAPIIVIGTLYLILVVMPVSVALGWIN